MIAVPIDGPHATTMSESYLEAPFFAMLDDETGYFSVVENVTKDDSVVNMIHESGADLTVCHTTDASVHERCMEHGIKLYELSENAVTLEQIYMDARTEGGLFE